MAGGSVKAKEKSDHPLWEAIRGVLVPKLEVPVDMEVRAPEKVLDTRPRIEVLHERPKPCAKRSIDEQVATLKDMYIGLGWAWSESGLVIPDRRTGFDRLFVFADVSLTNNRVFGVCEASFPCWRYTQDLNTAIPSQNDQRHPSRGPYAIWVKDEIDSDQDLANISSNLIEERCIKTVTFLERVLHELIHYQETGEHLDVRTWTLCCGSRYSNGLIPSVLWYGGRLKIGWTNPCHGDPITRARQVVAL
jgi:hypothetical protein